MGSHLFGAPVDGRLDPARVSLPLAEFLPVWGFLAANIVTPGPNVLTTIAMTLGSGRGAGLGSASGVGLGVGMWCLGMTLGIATVLRWVPGVDLLLLWTATGLLLWFASRYLLAAWRGYHARTRALPVVSEGLGFGAGFRRALAVNMVNPKALTSWLAVLGLFPTARADAGDLALLCAGACALSFAIHGAYTLAFSTPLAARAYLRSGWVLQGLAGVLFAGFALRLVAGA